MPPRCFPDASRCLSDVSPLYVCMYLCKACSNDIEWPLDHACKGTLHLTNQRIVKHSMLRSQGMLLLLGAAFPGLQWAPSSWPTRVAYGIHHAPPSVPMSSFVLWCFVLENNWFPKHHHHFLLCSNQSCTTTISPGTMGSFHGLGEHNQFDMVITSQSLIFRVVPNFLCFFITDQFLLV